MPLLKAPRRMACAMALATTILPTLPLTPALAAEGEAQAAPVGCTGPASNTWLRVTVDGVRSAKGLIAITLYADNPSKFLVRHGSMYVGRTPAMAGTTSSCIFVPKPGVYVLAVYHDQDGDMKFGRTGIGLPAEAYGFSNNPSTLFGLPSFQSVRLNVVQSGLSTRIHLTYP